MRNKLSGIAWLYVLLLIGLPAGNLVFKVGQAGPKAVLTELQKPDAIHAMVLTLGIAITTVVVGTLFGTLLAVTITRDGRFGRAWLETLMDIPTTTSPVVAGFLLAVLYGPQGWLGSFLTARGITVLHTAFAMTLASVFVSLPLVARQLIPLLSAEPTAQEEVAQTLGASRGLLFWRVTLPTLRPGLQRGMLLTFARALGEFGATIVVSGNLIGQTQTLTLWVHQEAGDFNMTGAYGAALVLAGLAIGALLLSNGRPNRPQHA